MFEMTHTFYIILDAIKRFGPLFVTCACLIAMYMLDVAQGLVFRTALPRSFLRFLSFGVAACLHNKSKRSKSFDLEQMVSEERPYTWAHFHMHALSVSLESPFAALAQVVICCAWDPLSIFAQVLQRPCELHRCFNGPAKLS